MQSRPAGRRSASVPRRRLRWGRYASSSRSSRCWIAAIPDRKLRPAMALSGAGFRRRASGLVRAPWPAYQLAVAVRADAVQRIGTRRAVRALVAANVRSIVISGERPRAALAAFAHFQSHDRFPLSRLVEQFAADQHPANLRPWAIWPRPPRRDLTFASLMLASSDRPKVLSRLVDRL